MVKIKKLSERHYTTLGAKYAVYNQRGALVAVFPSLTTAKKFVKENKMK